MLELLSSLLKVQLCTGVAPESLVRRGAAHSSGEDHAWQCAAGRFKNCAILVVEVRAGWYDSLAQKPHLRSNIVANEIRSLAIGNLSGKCVGCRYVGSSLTIRQVARRPVSTVGRDVYA